MDASKSHRGLVLDCLEQAGIKLPTVSISRWPAELQPLFSQSVLNTKSFYNQALESEQAQLVLNCKWESTLTGALLYWVGRSF